MNAKVFKGQAFNSDNPQVVAWGIEKDGVLMYETMFTYKTAKRLAELSEILPDNSWEEMRQILLSEKYNLNDPGEV